MNASQSSQSASQLNNYDFGSAISNGFQAHQTPIVGQNANARLGSSGIEFYYKEKKTFRQIFLFKFAQAKSILIFLIQLNIYKFYLIASFAPEKAKHFYFFSPWFKISSPDYGGSPTSYGGGQSSYGGGHSSYDSGHSSYGGGHSSYDSGHSGYGGSKSSHGGGYSGYDDDHSKHGSYGGHGYGHSNNNVKLNFGSPPKIRVPNIKIGNVVPNLKLRKNLTNKCVTKNEPPPPASLIILSLYV